MTDSYISNYLPDPFSLHPSNVAVPLTRTRHVSSVQAISTIVATTLTSSQCLAPLVFTVASGTPTVTLPTATLLLSGLGTATQVQVGDLFIISVYTTSTSTAFSITAGSGGTGTKSIPPYSTSSFTPVLVSFSNVTDGSVAYSVF
jgi:hypothetical protein